MKVDNLLIGLHGCGIYVYIGPTGFIVHDVDKDFIARSFQTQTDLFHNQTMKVPVQPSKSMSVVER